MKTMFIDHPEDYVVAMVVSGLTGLFFYWVAKGGDERFRKTSLASLCIVGLTFLFLIGYTVYLKIG
jgi:hypothetical protein